MDIRLARSDDAAAIADIYNHSVTTSTDVFDLVPRTLAEQQAWLSARSGAHAVLVAHDGTEVVGFASLSPYQSRPAYRTTVEDSVYVRHDRQGEGVGRELLDRLLELATDHGFHAVIARIAGANDGSVALHKACGFEQVGLEREVGRKFGRWLDVVVMERLL
jgi:phosphinothricin acetyltransferase